MSKSALIVIDVQSYFVNEFTKAIPEKIAKFITAKIAKALGVSIEKLLK